MIVGVIAAMVSKGELVGIAAEVCEETYKISFRTNLKEIPVGEIMLQAQEAGIVFSAGGHPKAGGSRVFKKNLDLLLNFVNSKIM